MQRELGPHLPCPQESFLHSPVLPLLLPVYTLRLFVSSSPLLLYCLLIPGPDQKLPSFPLPPPHGPRPDSIPLALWLTCSLGPCATGAAAGPAPSGSTWVPQLIVLLPALVTTAAAPLYPRSPVSPGCQVP